jgi:hypothetical protein
MNAILHPRSRAQTNRATENARKAKTKLETPWITTRTELLTMATHALPSPHILDDDAPEATTLARIPKTQTTWLRRLHHAILQSQMRRAEREIDRILGPGALSRIQRGLPPRG